MRRRMRQRHAGRQHQRRDLRPVEFGQIPRLDSGSLRLRDFLVIVVEGDDICAAFGQCARRQKTGLTEAEDRDLLPGEDGDGDQGLSQLQRGEPCERQHHGDDPEPNHDLRLGPAQLLIVMVDRRHPEHAFSGELEGNHLHDH